MALSGTCMIGPAQLRRQLIPRDLGGMAVAVLWLFNGGVERQWVGQSRTLLLQSGAVVVVASVEKISMLGAWASLLNGILWDSSSDIIVIIVIIGLCRPGVHLILFFTEYTPRISSCQNTPFPSQTALILPLFSCFFLELNQRPCQTCRGRSRGQPAPHRASDRQDEKMKNTKRCNAIEGSPATRRKHPFLDTPPPPSHQGNTKADIRR